MPAQPAATAATRLVADLVGRGVELREENGRLCFSAPPGVLSRELRNELVRRKAEVVAGLRAVAAAPREERPQPAAPFPHLFSPLAIGPLRLANRLVMSPMEVDFGAPDGSVTQRAVDYYAARAAGGVGMVVVEATAVDAPEGLISPVQLRADDDRFVPGLRRLAEGVRRHGVPVAIQLQHAGRKTSALVTGRPPVAPSAVANHRGESPRELADGEIEALVERYAAAAARVRLAGFDGVEIHAAHGYLVAQFLSPHTNRRADRWGGDLAGRARFLLAVVRAVVARTGAGFPVLCRLAAADLEAPGEAIRPAEGGLTLDEAARVAAWLEEAGVAAVDVSANLVGAPRVHPMEWPAGHLAPYAECIKRSVGVPVSMTARVPAELAERLIAAGALDLVRVGRPLLADPRLPARLASGEADGPPCIHCGVCTDPARRRPEVVCTVNPGLGREGAGDLEPAAAPRRVVVVGGGPAGLQAAAVAAARGHRVTLVERQERPGGLLRMTSKPAAAAAGLDALRSHLVRRALDAGVEILTGRSADPALVDELGAEAVVVAIGARAARPPLPGLDLPLVRFATEVLDGAPTGERVVVVGSEQVGCETALLLAASGRRVTLVGRREPARRVVADLRAPLLWALAEQGVETVHPAQVEAIVPEGVEVRTAAGRRRIAADTVVLATGAEPATELADQLAAVGMRVELVGDARQPRGLAEAIEEGYRAGCAL